MSLETFKTLCSALGERKLNYNSSSEIIEVTCIDKADVTTLKDSLTTIGIDAQEVFGNKVEFIGSSLPFKLFWNFQNFQNKMLLENQAEFEQKFSQDFAVIQADSPAFPKKHLYFDHTTKQTFADFDLTEDSFFFTNAENYVKFLHFLKSKEHKEDNFFHFVDYFSWDNRMIVFVSATKEGKLSIPFFNQIPDFDSKIDLSKRFERLYQAFDINDKKQKLPKFIKAEFFNFLSKSQRNKEFLS